MPWPTALSEPYWMIPADEWEAARERVGRIALPCQRQAFAALVDHMEAGWKIIAAIQVEADRIIHSGRRAPPAARAVAGFLECDPTDTYRMIAQMCTDGVPGGPKHWLDALGDVEGEAEEIVRHLRMAYMAASHHSFPPLLAVVLRDAYPRMAKWLKKLPSVLRPVERLAKREEAGHPVLMM